MGKSYPAIAAKKDPKNRFESSLLEPLVYFVFSFSLSLFLLLFFTGIEIEILFLITWARIILTLTFLVSFLHLDKLSSLPFSSFVVALGCFE